MCMQGPVFAQSDSSLKEARRDERSLFSLHGVTFGVEPSSLLVSLSFIQHYITTEANIARLRVLRNNLTTSKVRLA